jgi:hypothetical protein
MTDTTRERFVPQSRECTTLLAQYREALTDLQKSEQKAQSCDIAIC